MPRIGSFSLLAAYVVAFLVALAAPAGAGVEGPCVLSFNGIPFDDLDTPSEARERLVIQPGESVLFYAAVPDTDYAYVDIVFPPLTIPLFSGASDEPTDQSSEIYEIAIDLPLGAFAEYGAGIFQFVGRTDDCKGNAYFIIGGIEPWETAVGKTAIGIAGVGMLIGLTSWIPAIVSGGGGIVRSVIAGGPIGVGVAIIAQQAGLVPLSATSAGIAVAGSSVIAIVVTKGLGVINGVVSSGGAALPTPPPTSPSPPAVGAPSGSPPPPAETPMPPAQDAPMAPEKIFVDDASLLGGDPAGMPDATLTPEPSEVPAQGGELSPEPSEVPAQGGEVTPNLSGQDVPSAGTTPTPTESPSAPVQSTSPSGGQAPSPVPPPPVTGTPSPAAAPASPSAAGAPAGGGAVPPTPTSPSSPPAASAPPAPTTPLPPPSPASPGAPADPGTAGVPTGGSAGAPPAATGTPSPGAGTPPPTAGGVGGGGPSLGMAAGAAAAAGALGVASRAAAAQKRAMSGGGLSDPYWFYVSAPTDVYGLESYETVVGRLVPGDWYMAKATYDEWVHAFDEPSGLEGWIARSSAIAHGEPGPTP